MLVTSGDDTTVLNVSQADKMVRQQSEVRGLQDRDTRADEGSVVLMPSVKLIWILINTICVRCLLLFLLHCTDNRDIYMAS